jgi:hypothetical protein
LVRTYGGPWVPAASGFHLWDVGWIRCNGLGSLQMGRPPMTRFLRSPYAPLAAMALIAAYLLAKLTLIVNGVVS